jgi:MFS family permease
MPSSLNIGLRPAATLAFWTFAAAISVIVLGANTPLPLLTVYQSAWRFSTALLTVIYGLYTAGVLAAIFLLGPASDLVGRKRVLLPAIGVMAAGLIAGLLAQNVWTLMASRVLEGVAVGAGVTTAVAALGELSPDPGDHARIALTATVATVLGLAGGPLVAGALAQFAPHPLQTPYWAALALCALVFVGVALSPETVLHRTGLQLRPVSVAVPKAAAGAFWLATLVELTAYAVAGSFAALGASFARDILHIESHFAAGLVVALLFLCSAACQIAARRLSPRTAISLGLVVLIGGLVLFALTILNRSGVGLFISAAFLGAGHGAAYLGSQELTDRIAPADRRAQIFSAFQLGLYVGATAPALVVGFVAARTGLSAAALGFAVVVAALAVVTLGWVRLGRSARTEPEPFSLASTEPST